MNSSINKFVEKLPEGLWIDKPEMLFPWGVPLDELEKIGNPKKTIEVEHPERKRSKKVVRIIWEPITIHSLPEIKKLELSYLMTKEMTILFQGNFLYHIGDMKKLAKSLDTLFGKRESVKNHLEDRGVSFTSEHAEWHYGKSSTSVRFMISPSGFHVFNKGPAMKKSKWQLSNNTTTN